MKHVWGHQQIAVVNEQHIVRLLQKESWLHVMDPKMALLLQFLCFRFAFTDAPQC